MQKGAIYNKTWQSPQASKRTSETCEQTLHRQEHNRTHLGCAEGSALQCCYYRHFRRIFHEGRNLIYNTIVKWLINTFAKQFQQVTTPYCFHEHNTGCLLKMDDTQFSGWVEVLVGWRQQWEVHLKTFNISGDNMLFNSVCKHCLFCYRYMS